MEIQQFNTTIADISSPLGFKTISEVHTAHVGEEFASAFASVDPNSQPAWVIGLAGDTGAGKTTLTRGFIRACGYREEEIPSPSYSIVQEYVGKDLDIWHIDLYRIESASELATLGIEELCAVPGGVIICEWATRGLALFAEMDFELRLSTMPNSSTDRNIRLIATSERAVKMLAALIPPVVRR